VKNVGDLMDRKMNHRIDTAAVKNYNIMGEKNQKE